MLKNLSPLLTPDLLKVLAEMGHGDEIVLADANFTAYGLAGPGGRVLELAGASMRDACAAVLSLLPLDSFVERPIAYMQVGDRPAGYRSALQRAVIDDLLARGDATESQCEATERFAFYERTRRAYAIVRTGERQPYANFLFKKGVIAGVLEP